MLLTPKIFKDHPYSRLYGVLMREYKSNPARLAEDLSHRREQGLDWNKVAARLGWLTWEDCRDISRKSCPWMNEEDPKLDDVSQSRG